ARRCRAPSRARCDRMVIETPSLFAMNRSVSASLPTAVPHRAELQLRTWASLLQSSSPSRDGDPCSRQNTTPAASPPFGHDVSIGGFQATTDRAVPSNVRTGRMGPRREGRGVRHKRYEGLPHGSPLTPHGSVRYNHAGRASPVLTRAGGKGYGA